ncbi:MAG: hypothetical protein LBG92_09425 [Prevotellaceae bacterium]|jgi:hypothetical protein|nr:hypothetical protein [Prevotellaceae bacterium]
MGKLNLMFTVLSVMAFAPCVYGQDYLSEERAYEIQASGKYYWNECADFNSEIAKKCAVDGLVNSIIADKAFRLKQDDVQKIVFHGVHCNRLQLQGSKIAILAWIDKDSVDSTKSDSTKPEKDPLIIKSLLACKTDKEVRRCIKEKGLVSGNGSEGFYSPEKCIVVVCASSGALVALFDAGEVRIDLISGKTVQNIEQEYEQGKYSLLYIQPNKMKNEK